jgi:hypothetical protein
MSSCTLSVIHYFESRDRSLLSIALGTPKLFHQPFAYASVRNPPKSKPNPHFDFARRISAVYSLQIEYPLYGSRHCRFLKTFYRELGTRDPPHLPSWVSPLPLGTLCPAHFQPHLQLVHKSEQEHRLENIKPDQIFAPVRVSIVKIPLLSRGGYVGAEISCV